MDGIVLDLGVSSYQLDTEDRGFSYRFDAPLDMRMDRRQTLTARDIVNNYSEMELYHIIRDYGEDPFAKNIAKHIVKNRADKPIETTFAPEFPVCVCGKVSKGKVITRKPILPSVEELEVNSRSKSAKLRVFEKK